MSQISRKISIYVDIYGKIDKEKIDIRQIRLLRKCLWDRERGEET